MMPTTLKTAAEGYLRAEALSRATRNEYLSTLRKWEKWGGGIPVEQLRRKDLRPMNRLVQAHLRSLMAENSRPETPVFLGGGARPNSRFQELCGLAGIRPRPDIETGEAEPWGLKDLRKTCATYHDEHVPESRGLSGPEPRKRCMPPRSTATDGSARSALRHPVCYGRTTATRKPMWS